MECLSSVNSAEVTKAPTDWRFSCVTARQNLADISIPPDLLLFTALVGGWSLPLNLGCDPMTLYASDSQDWKYDRSGKHVCAASGHWPLGGWSTLLKATLGSKFTPRQTEAFLAVDGPRKGLVTFQEVRPLGFSQAVGRTVATGQRNVCSRDYDHGHAGRTAAGCVSPRC